MVAEVTTEVELPYLGIFSSDTEALYQITQLIFKQSCIIAPSKPFKRLFNMTLCNVLL